MHRKQNGYRSIHGKLLNALIFSWCLCMLFFALYYLLSTRADAFRQYERRTRADAEVTATNIDYYLGNTVSATKSIYFDQQLLQRVMADTAGYQTTEVRRDLFTYLHTISLTMPYAEQIYLAIPRQGVSVLYIPSTLRLSFNADEPYSLEEPIRMLTLYDTYLQPTHEMDTYGHIVSFSTPTEKTLVFTIWLPISNIPWSLASEAYVAIDIPLEFIMNNCQIDEENGELVYIVDSSGFIIASNLPEAVMQNADALDLPPGILDEETSIVSGSSIYAMAELQSEHFADWSVVRATPLPNVYSLSWSQTLVLVLVFALGLGGLLAFNVFQISRYTRPLVQLTRFMQAQLASGEWSSRLRLSDYIRYSRNDEIGTLVQVFETMLQQMHGFTVRQYELELANTESTLKMLQAQINPHFIYNTIQCFATNALRREDLRQYQLLTSFGKMLHYSMITDPPMMPLDREVEYVQRYLSLQSMRFDREIELHIDVAPDAAHVMVPKLTIQPLVENAVVHGRLFQKERALLRLSARVEAEWLFVVVEDSGAPIPQARVGELTAMMDELRERFRSDRHYQADPAAGGGGEYASIGVRNVFTRLMLFFGECDFTIAPNELDGTTVRFSIPILMNTRRADGQGEEDAAQQP